jgi:excisionase family DNA binding protein
METDWLTITEIATRYGVDPTAVRKWIKNGRLPARPVANTGTGHIWLVSEADLAGFVPPYAQRGNKPGRRS